MNIKVIATEFETILASLQYLTASQVADLVRDVVSEKDGAAFDALVGGLSPQAVRFLAARALLRLRSAGWLERQIPSA
jgi:hypothetical protein